MIVLLSFVVVLLAAERVSRHVAQRADARRREDRDAWWSIRNPGRTPLEARLRRERIL